MGLKSLFKKIWTLSPQSIFNKLKGLFVIKSKITFEKIDITKNQASGISIYLPTSLKSFYKNMSLGDYEAYIIDSLSTHTDILGKIIWDIGAHIGYHTLLFAKNAGKDGKVVAFEPNPDNRDSLIKNIALNNDLRDRISIRPEALSSKSGEGKMLISPNPLSTSSSGSHLSGIKTPYQEEVYKEFIETSVKLETIDNMILKAGLDMPDIIKMDVEGAEYDVLSGAKNLLKEKKPIMIIEIHNPETMHNVLNLLYDFGYATEIIDSSSKSLTKNILAISK